MRRVKRIIQGALISVVLLGASGGVAYAAPPPEASCVGQLAGTVAPGSAGLVGAIVSAEAQAGAGGEFGAVVASAARATTCPPI
jgi:hypothetical protein